jgi:hypothetical protein
MKMLLAMSLISLVASASFASSLITCKNTGFSNLTMELTPQSATQMSLKVTATGAKDEFMPSVGESSLLNLDSSGSAKDYMVLRSNSNEEQRAFEVSIRKADLAKTYFPATINISREDSDDTFNAFGMTCEKK